MLLPLVLGVLVITGRLRSRTLPVIAFVVAIAWLSFGASPFWKGHLDLIFGGFGNLGGNLSAGLTKRAVAASFERQAMLDVRIAMAGLLLLGTIGFFRRHRAGVNNVGMAVLTAVPFAVVASKLGARVCCGRPSSHWCRRRVSSVSRCSRRSRCRVLPSGR